MRFLEWCRRVHESIGPIKDQDDTKGKNPMGKIKKYVNEAHKIFDMTSVFEVIDKDNVAAVKFLNEAYDNPCPKSISLYLDIVEKLRHVTEGKSKTHNKDK